MSSLTKVTLPNGALANDSVAFLGAGSLFTTGKVFFVNSVIGSDGNVGTDPTAPLATVQQAINSCTANKGDKIVVMVGHAETVTATSINLNKAGVSVICLGSGLERPTFTYSAAAATITVSAAGCAFLGGHHIANFLNVASAFTVGAAKDFQLIDNTFVDTSSILNFLSLVVTGAVDNAADGLTLSGNYYLGLATTANAVLSVLGNLNRLTVTENHVDKAATNDAGQMITLSSKVCLGAKISKNNLIVVGSAGATVGIFMTGSGTTSTGIVSFNSITSADATAPLVATATLGFGYFENYIGNVNNSGKLLPAAMA